MPATVYFCHARGSPRRNKFDRLTELLERNRLAKLVSPGDFVAVKVHWGERGNADFIAPHYVRHLVQAVLAARGKPFVTDSNTLYRIGRHNAVDNLETAVANGYSSQTLGCPVIIADGLKGTDFRTVPLPDGRHAKEARIASAIADADALVVVSHVKGHMIFGFGGAVKNLGMGGAAAAAKQYLHAEVKPRVDESRCTACGLCVQHCRFGAIELVSGDKGSVARIEATRCSGCGECLVVCPAEAIPITWGDDFCTTQEKTAEYALAAVAGKAHKALYVSFLTSITPDCDCCSWSDAPLVPDIGWVAGTDPVAVDQASLDLVNTFTGFQDREQVPAGTGDRFRAVHDVDPEIALCRAEELGLGKRAYKLVDLG